ncbi:MAG TPA: dihydropyrimidinase [Candidatus Pelethomonas intestinigallinarum]|nr:dihydropyrimidinase [Candidatus Pelethomonas intestinigallinarum]
MRTLFKGGTVVSGQGTRPADVLVEGGTISAVGTDLSADGAQIVDCAGKLLFPGFIDAHTHFDLAVAGTVTADDFATGSRAALRGGTTTVIDYAAPDKGETLAYGLAKWREKAAGRCACDYGFHMTIDDWSEGISREMGEMVDQGIPTFKMYMTYPAMMLPEGDLYRALKRLRELGCLTGVHCENSAVIDALIAEAKAAGRIGPASHPRTRPAPLEAEAVSRLLRIAQVADVPVIIVHLSTREGLEEVRAARRRGQTVYVETCPQYLLLDESVYDAADYLDAARYVCAPPIRGAADRDALWEALKSGEIQTVATDHCSFTLEQKRMGREDFTKIPGGLPGVEDRGVLLYTAGVAAGRIDEAAMCRLLSENAAKLYGCWPRKGVIAPGSDADIVIYDPAAEGAITAADHIQNVDYDPYEGIPDRGTIHQVYLRGTLAVDRGQVLAGPDGQFIPRGRSVL